MKKITLLLLCLILGVGVCDAKKKNRRPEVSASTEIVVEKSYTGLRVDNMVQVVLEADRNPNTIRIETKGVPLESVITVVRQGVLRVGCEPNALKSRKNDNGSKSVVIYVGIGSLDTFSCSGMSSISSKAVIDQSSVVVESSGMSQLNFGIKSQSLKIILSGMSAYQGNIMCEGTAVISGAGMSQFSANIECQNLDLSLVGMSVWAGNTICHEKVRVVASGTSECTVTGSTQDLNLTVSGMSVFKGKNFSVSGLADCNISGMSTAAVATAGKLKFNATGMSQFNYSGDPVIVSASVDDSTVRNR